MPSVLLTLLCLAAFVWYLFRQLRALMGVRSRVGLAAFLNKRNSNLQTGLTIAEVGSKRAARDSFGATHHPASLGLRFLATVLAPVLFFVGNSMLLEAKGRDVPAELAPWLGLGLLVLVLWYLAYIWTYSVELTCDTLRVPSLLLFRRSYPLENIVRVDDTGAYFVKVRFRSGRPVEVLKYVAGRDTLMEALERRAQHAEEGPCQSSPKSKRFGAVSFR